MLPKIRHKSVKVKLPYSKLPVEIRPFTIKEERIIIQARENIDPDNDDGSYLAEFLDAVSEVIDSVVEKPEGFSSKDLFVGDASFVMKTVRSMSVNDDLHMVVKCGSCGNETAVKVSLASVSYPEIEMSPQKVCDIDTDEGKVELLFSPPTFGQVIESIRLDNSMESVVYSISLLRKEGDKKPVRIKDTIDYEEFKQWVQSLPVGQFEAMLENIQKYNVMRCDIDFKCPKCGHEEKMNPCGETTQDFFM